MVVSGVRERVLSYVWWLETSAEMAELLEQKSNVMLAGVSGAEELLTPQ